MKKTKLFTLFASLLFLAMPSAVLAQLPRINSEPTPLNLTYNGNARQLLSPGDVDYGEWQYSLTSGGNWSDDIPTATSAGEYPVYVKVKAYDGPRYDVYLGPIIATIQKAAPSYSTKPTAKTGLTFNGTAQALVTTGFTDDGVVEYRLGNAGSWGTGVPTAVKAGEYTVHYRIVKGENHYDSVNEFVSVTIGTRNIANTAIEVVPNLIECTGYTVKPSTVKVMDSGIGYTLVEGEDYTLTNAGGVAPGNYTVAATGKGNYTGSKSGAYSIVGSLSSADVKLEYASAVYTGSALTPVETVTIGSLTLVKGTDYNVEYSNNINVGTATVKVTGIAPKYTGSATATFNITPKQLTEDMVTLNEDRFTYSGGPQKPEVSVKDGGAALATSDYLLDNAGGTNADNYYVTVYGANNYTGTVTKMYIISPKDADTDPSITAELVDGDNFVYKGVSQTPNIRVKYDRIPLEEVIDYTISYQGVTDPSYNSKMAPIAAGTYNAVVTFVHNYAGEREVEFTIKKAPLTITADNFTVTYGEDAPQYTVTYKTFQGGEDSDVLDGTLEFDCLYEAGKPVNTYSITPKGFASNNYEITYVAGTLTVVNADAVVVTAPQANELTYNATEQELVVAGSAEGGVMKYSLNGNDYFEGVPTAVNAGVYSVYYKVEADGNHNDYYAPDPIVVEIEKAELTATAEDKEIIFGEEMPESQYSIAYAGWQGSDDESVLTGTLVYDCDYVQGKPVGKYLIEPSGVEADNYNIVFVRGTLTVDPKDVNDITVERKDGDVLGYKGVRQAPEIIVKDGDKLLENAIDYSISYQGVTDPSYESEMAPIAAGEYSVEVTLKRNYTGVRAIFFTIEKAPLTITADDYTITFGDEAPEYTVTYATFQGGEDPSVLEGTIAFTCEYAAGKPVNTYSITPRGLESNNYEITYVPGTLTVVRADAKVLVAPVANDLTYNAEEQALVTAGEAEGGVMKYSLNGVDYSENVPTALKAGSYSVYYMVEADGNHNDYIAPEPIAVEIKKADLTITANDKTIIYGEEAVPFTESYDGFKGNDDKTVLSGTLEFACDYVPGTSDTQGSPVGKYDIVPSGVDAENYNIEFVTGTLTVDPKSATSQDITAFQIDGEQLVYNGVRQTPDIYVKDLNKVLEEVIDYTISYTSDDPAYDSKMAPIEAGTYKAVITMKRNYTDETYVEFTIAPAPLTITADNFEIIYGDEAPAYTVTYKTFQGGEDPDMLEGTLAFDCAYAVGSGVGTYTITPSGLESRNYEITYVDGTLTVVPAELTITADDKSVIYGDNAPEFTVSYDGFKAGDDESSLDGDMALDCEYAPGTFVGEYAIVPSGVSSDNYNITFIDGTLTVTRAEVYVSGATVYPAKFEDGGVEAVITAHGELNGIKLSDEISHTVTSATYNDAAVGENKIITLTYELNGDADLLTNYLLKPVSEDYAEKGSIIEQIIPDNEYQSEAEATIVVNGIEIYAYGYCDGSDYSLKFHLKSGNPDQYKIVFDSDLIEDVDWTYLETPGKEGVITLALPEDLPAGDYNMTVFFRDSRFDWLESAPIPASIRATVAESFVVPLFNNTIAVVDTCQCFSDIQWFYRASEEEEWEALRGATGYYYHSNEKLTGEYFVRASMNGETIYSCPQKDMDTLYGSDKAAAPTVSAFPNPATDFVTVSIEGSEAQSHTLQIVNMAGVEVLNTTFEGASTRIDLANFQEGTYMVSVDGIVVKVIKQ